jgi:hypothetical protein
MTEKGRKQKAEKASTDGRRHGLNIVGMLRSSQVSAVGKAAASRRTPKQKGAAVLRPYKAL